MVFSAATKKAPPILGNMKHLPISEDNIFQIRSLTRRKSKRSTGGRGVAESTSLGGNANRMIATAHRVEKTRKIF